MVVFGQSGCIRAKLVVFERIDCVRAKWLCWGKSFSSNLKGGTGTNFSDFKIVFAPRYKFGVTRIILLVL